jgi:hypothetical protein
MYIGISSNVFRNYSLLLPNYSDIFIEIIPLLITELLNGYTVDLLLPHQLQYILYDPFSVVVRVLRVEEKVIRRFESRYE